MNTSEITYVGVDVSKNTLEVFLPSWSQTQTFQNTAPGHRLLSKALNPSDTKLHIILEPTAGYEAALLDHLRDQQIPYSLINPVQARAYAKAVKIHAKTDSIDAKCLADFGATHKPQATRYCSKLQAKLKALSRRRSSLVAQRTRELSSLDRERDSFVRAEIKSLIQVIERHLAKLEREIERLVRTDEDTAQRRGRMSELVGVGPVLANTLIAEMPELGMISDKQVTALAGLAPYNRDSGKWKGQRFVQGGRSQVRRALYMPTLTATQHNKVLKAFYTRMLEAGKPHKVALTATMRKLLCVLNRMLADPHFQPS